MVSVTARAAPFDRGMRRATASMRRFSKATERANEQVRAFQRAAQPLAHKIRKRRKVAAKPKLTEEDVERELKRLLKAMKPLWRFHQGRAVRENSKRDGERFAKSYLWPGKRRFQACK